MTMIFKWVLWGRAENAIEMLYWSVISFRKWFGVNHRYIIITDAKKLVEKRFEFSLEVYEFLDFPNSVYNVVSKATWKKWCPDARIDKNVTEFYIDTDVFLLKEPTEIYEFMDNPNLKYAILDEYKGEAWQHGAMKRKATSETPFINAGFFIQKATYNISTELHDEYIWWTTNIKSEEQTHHDEQGCLAIALSKYFQNGELYILPKKRYIIISEEQNSDKNSLEDVTLIHATYPEHPAFFKFNKLIKETILSKR